MAHNNNMPLEDAETIVRGLFCLLHPGRLGQPGPDGEHKPFTWDEQLSRSARAIQLLYHYFSPWAGPPDARPISARKTA